MSLYVKVFTNFYTHRKTMRLRAILGDDAFWLPPRLWAYAAENQPDGDFTGYTAGEMAGLIGYVKDATSMLQAMLQAGFLDPGPKIHDWAEHNAYHQVFSDRARCAAKAKWEKERTKERGTEKTGEDKTREDRSQALHQASLSNASSIHPTPEKGSVRAIALKLKERLNVAYNRKPDASWDYAEESAAVEIARRPGVESELEELIQFQGRSEPRYFPNSVPALLAKWSATLDRARQPATNGHSHQPQPTNVITLEEKLAKATLRDVERRFGKHKEEAP